MTSLDVFAGELREKAAKVRLPSLSTIIVTLIALIPFLLAFAVNAIWQFLRILKAAWLKGWETGEARMGAKPSGGS